ncbi:hypothetical protein J6590_046561 [Homalodisca vitripennis]|nr:hypothetical protein J6590_046561 [Homalodisca vitripennis]
MASSAAEILRPIISCRSSARCHEEFLPSLGMSSRLLVLICTLADAVKRLLQLAGIIPKPLRINHEMLPIEMIYNDFGESVISRIRSYLQERQQLSPFSNYVVYLKGATSAQFCSTFTHQTSRCVCKLHSYLYADDCQLHLAYETDMIEMAISQINADLYHVTTWSIQNGLRLNISKCKVLQLLRIICYRPLVRVGVRPCAIELKLLTSCWILASLFLTSPNVCDWQIEGFVKIQNITAETCTTVYLLMGTAFRERTLIEAKSCRSQPSMCRLLTCYMVYKVLKFKEPQYLNKKLVYRKKVLNEAPVKMEGFTSRK